MNTPLGINELQARLQRSPFIRFLNLEVLECDIEAATIVMRLPMRDEFERLPESGQLHGGVIAAAIDTVGDYALIAQLNAAVPTINFRTDYLRPAMGPYFHVSATVRRAGRAIGVVDVDVTDSDGRLVAVGRGCYGTAST